MIPKNFDGYSYPVFQPDQLLSADHLNHAFNFNEQEERLTRTNLIGIGIVCGLKATKSTDGSLITISKGTGVTSHGYLITHGKENSEEAIEYRQWRPYNMLQTNAYDLFWADGVQKYALYELLSAEEAESKDNLLDNAFLRNKVCLVFYEKTEVEAKNCDTTSCDDRGRTITVTIRKLLIHENDAQEIIQACYEKANLSGNEILFPLPTPIYVPPRFPNPRPKITTATQQRIASGVSLPFILPPAIYTTSDTLPDLRMPRYDVSATDLEKPGNVLDAYQLIFSERFIDQTAAAFTAVYQALKGYLGLDTNPFTNFGETFRFLHDGSIGRNDLLHFQYYYDFFSDLMMAYAELKESSYKTGALCTPPEALFPRHLFLGKLSETNTRAKSRFRTYFIPSPVTARQEDAYQETKSLYDRLLRMLNNFELPTPTVELADESKNIDTNIRITPSQIGKMPLGDRAIPYYYNPLSPDVLLDVWNYSLSKRGLQHQNLGYFATEYNHTDGFVRTPLRYDLEPYNFFRVEGHIGKTMETALASIQAIRDEYRLPFDVVPVNAGSYALPSKEQLAGHFNDMEVQYQVLKNEIWCRLSKAYECVCALPIRIDRDPTQPNVEPLSLHPQEIENTKANIGTILETYQAALNQGLDVSQNMLLMIERLNDVRTTIIRPDEPSLNILCHVYQKFKEELLKGGDSEIVVINMRKEFDGIRQRTGTWATVEVEADIQFVLLLSLLDRYKALLPKLFSELNMVNIRDIQQRIDLAYDKIVQLKPIQGLSCISGLKNMCLNEDLDIIYQLYEERLNDLTQRLTLAEFSKAHPGLQHKGGVPTGGTLVLVYQQTQREIVDIDFAQEQASHERATAQPADTAQQPPIYEHTGASPFAIPAPANSAPSPTNSAPGTAPAPKEKAAQPAASALLDRNNGRIIADFYLPYLCCSDCPSIQVTIAPPAPAELLFSLPEREYCSDYMPERIPFKMSPLGGTIVTDTPEALYYGENDSMVYFVPSKINFAAGTNFQDLTFMYQVNNSSIPFSVRVYRQPKVSVILEKDEKNPRILNFSLDYPEQVTQALWDFGDGGTAASLSGKHQYTAAGKFVVRVQVWNGTCSYTPEPTAIGISVLTPIKIDPLPGEFCIKAEPFHFSISPDEGKISGILFDEIRETGDGNGGFILDPSLFQLGNSSSKTVGYVYTAPAGNSRPFSATVYATPSGRFTMVDDEKRSKMLLFTSLRHVKTIRVDDGREEQEYDTRGASTFKILLDYESAQSPDLTISVHNGPCKAILTRRDEGTQTCQSLTVPVEAFTAIRQELGANQMFLEHYGPERFELLVKMFKELEVELAKGSQYGIAYVRANDILKPEWIRMIPINKPEVKTPSLQLLAILTDLATTISCIKREDVDKGTITTVDQLDEILVKIPELPTPSPLDVDLLEQIKKDTQNEIDRLKINDVYKLKPVFLKRLQEIDEAARQAQNRNNEGTTTPISTRSCQPLNVVLDNFEPLIPALQTPAFKQAYGADLLDTVIGYFNKVNSLWKAEEQQIAIDFVLKEKVINDAWIKQLPVNHPDLQSTALGLLFILSDMVTTISCLKDEDTPQGEMQTNTLLQAIDVKIQEVSELKNAEEVNYIEKMLSDVHDEQMRIGINGDMMKKPTLSQQLMGLSQDLYNLKNRSEGSGGEQNPTLKSFQPLSIVIENFTALMPVLKDPAFMQAYGDEVLTTLAEHIDGMKSLWNPEEPIPAINYAIKDSNFDEAWITKIPVNEPEHRTTALGLLAVLSDLVTTMSCLKDSDTPFGAKPTNALLMAIETKVREVNSLVAQRDFDYVESMKSDILNEQYRVMVNNETMQKPTFGQQLISILNELINLQSRSANTTPATQSCQPLNVVLSDFQTLAPALQNSAFVEMYGSASVNGLMEFFTELHTRWSNNPAYANEYLIQQAHIAHDWITRLPVNAPEQRTTALALLAVLSDLTTTISCLKPEDNPYGQANTSNLMALIIDKVREVTALQSPQDNTYIQNMEKDVADEQERMEINTGTMIKPVMEEELQKLYDELNKLKDRSQPTGNGGE